MLPHVLDLAEAHTCVGLHLHHVGLLGWRHVAPMGGRGYTLQPR